MDTDLGELDLEIEQRALNKDKGDKQQDAPDLHLALRHPSYDALKAMMFDFAEGRGGQQVRSFLGPPTLAAPG